jgi:hypothetical protein
MSYYRTQLEDWLKTIDVKADRVLDVGGAANPVKGRTKSWEVREYAILDNHNEEPKQKADFLCDINIAFPANVPAQQASTERHDVIFCLEVMEYVYDPLTALKNLNFLLDKKDTLYITFPLVYPRHNPVGFDCLRYTEAGAIRLLQNAGFVIDEIKYRYHKNPELLKTMYAADGMRAARDIDHGVTGYMIKARKA